MSKKKEWAFVLVAVLFFALALFGYTQYKDVSFSPSSVSTKEKSIAIVEQCLNGNYLQSEGNLDCQCLFIRLTILKALVEYECKETASKNNCESYKICLEDKGRDCSEFKEAICNAQNNAGCKEAIDKYDKLVDEYNSYVPKCEEGTLSHYNLFKCVIDGNNIC